MVDLFKKKPAHESDLRQDVSNVEMGDSESVAPTKKSLFGKSARAGKGSAERRAKMSLFAKKSATDEFDAPARGAAVYATPKSPNANSKIAALLAIVLALAVLGYVAKLFLFSEPETITSTAPVPAPQSAPEPMPQEAMPQESMTQETMHQDVVSSQTAQDAMPQPMTEPMSQEGVSGDAMTTSQETDATTVNASTNIPPQSTQAPVQGNANAQSGGAQPASTQAPATSKVGYDEFLQEAGNRIYIERDTTPPGR